MTQWNTDQGWMPGNCSIQSLFRSSLGDSLIAVQDSIIKSDAVTCRHLRHFGNFCDSGFSPLLALGLPPLAVAYRRDPRGREHGSLHIGRGRGTGECGDGPRHRCGASRACSFFLPFLDALGQWAVWPGTANRGATFGWLCWSGQARSNGCRLELV